MQNNKISDYGYSFQIKLLACFMTKYDFLGQIYDLIKVDYFESKSIRFLVKHTLEYFKDYKKLPTFEVYRVPVQKIDDVLLQDQVLQDLKEVKANLTATDLQFIQDKTVTFCKHQEFKAAILYCAEEGLDREDWEGMRGRVEDALKVDLDTDIGGEYVEDLDHRYEESTRKVVATPWKPINEVMGGGLANGEFGFMMAPTGTGKTWYICHLGAQGLRDGKTVVHYTLELDRYQTEIRYDTIITGIPLPKCSSNIETIRERIDQYKGQLIVKDYAMSSVSVMTIKAHLDSLRAYGINPDLILIDYAELLSLERYSHLRREDQMLKELFKDITALAKEYDTPTWTVSQVNREGSKSSSINIDAIASSYAKADPAYFVLSLSRKPQDVASHTGRFFLAKNRLGPDKLEFPAKIDLARGIMDIYPAKSKMGREQKGKMQSDEKFKKVKLRDRFDLLMEHDDEENNEITISKKDRDEAMDSDLF